MSTQVDVQGAITTAMQQFMGIAKLPCSIEDVYKALDQVIPEDETAASWSFDDYTTTARDGMAGDDAKDMDLKALKVTVIPGQVNILIEGGFEDVPDEFRYPVSIVIDVPEPAEVDPICVCGVHRSEHMLLGCPEGFISAGDWKEVQEFLFADDED